MASKVALITGATGAVGPALAWHLHRNGYRVRALGRTTSTPGLLPPDVEFYLGDITDPASIETAVQGADIIFHLAALLHVENPPPEMTGLYQQINVQGARNVAKQAAAYGVQRLAYFSTIKVYGVEQAVPVDESCLPGPKTIYARTKLDGEKAVLEFGSVNPVVLRLSPVYGPRLRGSWRRMVSAIRRGWFIPIGNLQNVHSLTYVEDVARAAVTAAEHPETAGNMYNVVGHETPTFREILTAIYAAADHSMPRFSIPSSLAYAAAMVGEKAVGLAGKRSPLSREAISQLVRDEAYSGTRLQQIGFTSWTSLNEGWKKSI